jgi:hypothetical protein
MRFTSSRRSPLALFLCVTLFAQWSFAGFVRAEEPSAEPALLLKISSPEIPEETSRPILDPLPGLLAEALRVRFVPVPAEFPPVPVVGTPLPLPDDAALRRIAGMVSAATVRMENVENEEAERLLSEAEREARAYRFDESTRPFLSEIFLRMGTLRLREGDAASAEAFLARSRALRPEFSPDPAIFPPQFLAAWERARMRPAPDAEILVQSLPAGADIFLDGQLRGTTPSRVRIGKPGPHRIRVSYPGYREAEREGQWLPGDSEILSFQLPGDRMARIVEIVAGPLQGSGSGPILSELAADAGAIRIAILVLDRDPAGTGLRARLYARDPAGGDAVRIGEKTLTPGARIAGPTGIWAARALASSGWPEIHDAAGREDPWYRKWWVWAVAASIAAGIALAAGGGGGGGSSGSTGGSIGVDF